jgi:hypothetical protein
MGAEEYVYRSVSKKKKCLLNHLSVSRVNSISIKRKGVVRSRSTERTISVIID